MQQHIQNFKSQFSLPRAIAICLGLLLIVLAYRSYISTQSPPKQKKCPIPTNWNAVPTEQKTGKFTIKKDDCKSKKLRDSSKKYTYTCKADGTITPNTPNTPNTNPCSPSPLKKQDKSCTIKWPNTKPEKHPHNKTFIPTCKSPGKKKYAYDDIQYKCINGIITRDDTEKKDDTDPCDRTCGMLPTPYIGFKPDPQSSSKLNEDSVIPTDKKRNTYCFVEGFENYVPQPLINIYDWMGGRPDINNNFPTIFVATYAPTGAFGSGSSIFKSFSLCSILIIIFFLKSFLLFPFFY